MDENYIIRNFGEISESNALTLVEYRRLFQVLCDKGLRLGDIQLKLGWGSGIGQNVDVVDQSGNVIADITEYESW